MDLKREHELGQTAEARKRTDRDLRCIGWGLVLLGVLMPALVTVENTGIYRTLMNGIYQGQEIYVLLAALKLVVLNAVRAYPHYMGVFFLVETFRGMELRRRLLASIAAVGILIPGVYLLINRIYGIRYDFGIPALSMIAMIWVLAKIDFSFVGLMKKGLMVAFFITALQFLDMMPLLWNFPFGRGESSYDIKLVSKFLQADSFLQAMATIFFALFLFMSVLLLLLVVDENNIRRISEQKELNEHMLMETRMRILENRTYMELRHLVHDLKSPLTSMQALVGVVKLSAGRRGDQTEGEYLERIETIIDRMSSMISEILHEEQRSVVTTQELLDAVMAQISSAEYADLVHTENRAPEAKIRINKIRFSRVLINLVENAAYAVRRPDGKIWIRVEETEGAEIRFQVEDNGTGIPRELLGEIWEKGFSIRSSSGLGLNFVQQVVEQCGGSVELESVEREGTVVTVSLPPCEEDVCETGPV